MKTESTETQEKKLETLEEATMAVLRESPTTDAVMEGFVPFPSPELDKATEAFKLAKDAFNNLEKSKEILSSLVKPNFKYADEINNAVEIIDYMLHSSPERMSIFKKVLSKISSVVSIFSKHGEWVD